MKNYYWSFLSDEQYFSDHELYQNVQIVSILGTQSTGKSSLLNSMYNLDFAVTAARTTKGINMRILKSRNKRDTFILLDTEGLRALELKHLNQRQQRKNDNRLATFVLGIADICLVNLEKFDHTHLSGISLNHVVVEIRYLWLKLNHSNFTNGLQVIFTI